MSILIDRFIDNLEHPENCPHCHKHIYPEFKQFFHAEDKSSRDVIIYVVWGCSNKKCERTFVSSYIISEKEEIMMVEFMGFLDGYPASPAWPKTILNLKSKFINTYNQALKAENQGLDEIAGMGFRKAIEYLVKDYLIGKNAALKGTIENMQLAKVINDHFIDPKESDLKDLLVRATWLGNDLTHYLKYHVNFDINDLKELISLVVDEIHSIEQKRHYINKIQSKYNKP